MACAALFLCRLACWTYWQEDVAQGLVFPDCIPSLVLVAVLLNFCPAAHSSPKAWAHAQHKHMLLCSVLDASCS